MHYLHHNILTQNFEVYFCLEIQFITFAVFPNRSILRLGLQETLWQNLSVQFFSKWLSKWDFKTFYDIPVWLVWGGWGMISRYNDLSVDHEVSFLMKIGLLSATFLLKKWSPFGLLFGNLSYPKVLGTLYLFWCLTWYRTKIWSCLIEGTLFSQKNPKSTNCWINL